MLFNSYSFLFLFLPVVVMGFYILQRFSRKHVVLWLTTASLFFYGWWNSRYLALLGISIVFNYLVGITIISSPGRMKKRLLFLLGIAGNLAALAYFKYSLFVVKNINSLSGLHFNFTHIILPLGISFFTFTQLAFLADAYYKNTEKIRFLDYSLFVTYFPHLIAGPIIHHKDVIPQFKKFQNSSRLPLARLLITGISIFIVGLCKKVCLADPLSPIVDSIFSLPARHYDLSFIDSWVGALSYTFQLYFDFSGYSDMAIGLSIMLGVKLPANFFSPYKALSIIDFWKRWHISLSRFFRDYLYIPLGGNRKGVPRQFINILFVMTLVGIWHGAGWTFIAWGALHGVMLTLNHSWRFLRKYYNLGECDVCGRETKFLPILRFLSWALTFFLLVITWVIFRAHDFATVNNIFHGLFLKHRFYHGSLGLVHAINYVFIIPLLFLYLIICTCLPNSIEIMSSANVILEGGSLPALTIRSGSKLLCRANIYYALYLGGLAYFAIVGISSIPSKFLYFNF